MSLDDHVRLTLDELRARGLLRSPFALEGADRAEAVADGRPVVVFCSNDYLGLAAHPELVATAQAGLAAHGLGAGASRLISGTHTAHRECERAMAAWVERPAALLFSTGYAANLGALGALLGPDDVAFSDRLNHASLIDGLRLSRARVHIFDHADPGHLEILLRTHRAEGRRALIVTDTVFSMDGDLAPLGALRELADAHDAGLYVDEAHALGVLGGGRGACAEQGIRPDVLLGTLGKASGVAGAFVAGSESLRQLLENRARSYVFSTAPPPALAVAATRAAALILDADAERARVHAHAERIRAALRTAGWTVPGGRTPIIPLLVGDPARTMELSRRLLEEGYFVQGIRPPTVPEGSSRLRIVPTAAHTDAQVSGLLAAFSRVARPKPRVASRAC